MVIAESSPDDRVLTEEGKNSIGKKHLNDRKPMGKMEQSAREGFELGSALRQGIFMTVVGKIIRPWKRDAKEGGAAPGSPRPRDGNPVPFFRSGYQATPHDGAQTPHSVPVTPPLTTTISNLSSPDTPDTTGRQTPSTPVTPLQSAPHISPTDSIRRKPVPAPSYDNLRGSSEGRASTARNPLEKATVTIVPELLGGKAPSTPDSRPRTRVDLPGRRKATGWRRVVRVGRPWWVEGVWCCVSLLCIVSEFSHL